MAKRYVCAVDGSKVADRAAACAVELAKCAGAKLTFLNINIIPTRAARTYCWDARPVAASNLQSHTELAAAAKIAKAAKFSDFDSITANGKTVADAIVAYARKNKADHVIVGTATTNELARIFLGSVATAVVSHADCPVTVVK
jgi:nucleotide-binding universal stress UspA family protein